MISFRAGSHALENAGEGIFEESGRGSLTGEASHLFVVKDAVHADLPGILTMEKPFQGCESALQVVQTGSGDKFLRSAPDGAVHAVVEIKVHAQDLFLPDACGFGCKLPERPFRAGAAEQRQQFFLGIVGVSFIGAPVHVNGQAGNHQKIPVDIDQTGLDAGAVSGQDAPCRGERAVEPGSHEHAPVLFHVQFYIVIL